MCSFNFLKGLTKPRSFIITVFVLVFLNLAIIGSTYSRYVTKQDFTSNTLTAVFSPKSEFTISSSGESWSAAGSIGQISGNEPIELRMAIDNSDSDCHTKATFIVSTSKKLPVEIIVYPVINGVVDYSSPLEPIEAEFGRYVYEYELGIEVVEFCPVLVWDADEYDESFNEVSDYIMVEMVCEQID